MVAFQKENPCSLSEHLKLSCRYGKEFLANINAGIRSSPESNLWMSRIYKTNGFRQNSTLAKSLVVNEANTEAKIDEWGRRTILHHSRLPIPVRLVSRYEQSSEEKIRRVSENAHVEDVANNEDNSSTASTLAGSKITPTGEVNWLWLCQADIIPGYWATPWKHLFSEAVCLGAISVLLKLLETFTDATNCQYMKSPPLRFWIGFVLGNPLTQATRTIQRAGSSSLAFTSLQVFQLSSTRYHQFNCFIRLNIKLIAQSSKQPNL